MHSREYTSIVSCHFHVGLIPNSILRSKLGYVPPKVTIPVQQPKAIKQEAPVVQLNKATKEVAQTGTDRVEHESSVAVETKETGEMVTDLSGLLESAHVEKKPKDLAKREVHAPSTEKQTTSVAREGADHETVLVGSDDSTSTRGEGGGAVSSQREATPEVAMSQGTEELAQKETSESCELLVKNWELTNYHSFYIHQHPVVRVDGHLPTLTAAATL